MQLFFNPLRSLHALMPGSRNPNGDLPTPSHSNASHYFLDPDHGLNSELQFHFETFILGINPQIHDEASTVFYTKFTLVVCPGDIAVLRSRLKINQTINITEPNEVSFNIWRYNPLVKTRSLQSRQSTTRWAAQTYGIRQLVRKWYLHVFSRFQNIIFQLSFRSLKFPDPNKWQNSLRNSLSMSQDYEVSAGSLTTFAAYISSTKIIKIS
jgi:hypothetical protein